MGNALAHECQDLVKAQLTDVKVQKFLDNKFSGVVAGYHESDLVG